MHLIDPGTAAEHVRRAANLLQSALGASPMAAGRAAGRVNLVGEHTDYNQGLCLPLALPHATYTVVAPRTDDQVRAVSTLATGTYTGDPATATGWAAYSAGVVWALREEGIDVPGIDMAIASSVPVGAGLSSSAALSCSVAMAIGALVGPIDPEVMLRATIRAEHERAGAPTGGMDQTVALFATPGEALLLDFADGTRTPVTWAPPGLALLVIDTCAPHALADGQYAARRSACDEAAAALGVPSLRQVEEPALAAVPDAWLPLARHVVTENRRVEELVQAVAAGDWAEVGALMTSSHESLRDDFAVSCDQLDVAVQAALDHGALGARMTGGGFGGSAIALVPEDLVQPSMAAVAAAYASRHWREPRFLRA
ncbi:galactokinase [Nocardioides jiangxiensis]|uniref:Galactokinase family protein n=1 Tax=Nocardioides jiangxiensis TaxID=3064524 RepID=A0ABT9B462_9ACTN|nr:galactokinase family protein [Nocardioides sp. WY-20]MDO7869629.1 galactokinase family protein [Nocardioides sp. WY-20]